GTGSDKRKQSPNPMRYMRTRIVSALSAAEFVVTVAAISIPPMDEAEVHRRSFAPVWQAIFNTVIDVSGHRHSCFHLLIVFTDTCQARVTRFVFAETLLNRVSNFAFLRQNNGRAATIGKFRRAVVFWIERHFHLLNQFGDEFKS